MYYTRSNEIIILFTITIDEFTQCHVTCTKKLIIILGIIIMLLLGDVANQISAETLPLYDLHAVVYHYGNSYIGHFTNMAKAANTVL